jgi:protein-S-isoprenylcysteine O-methyltransferase Ste14
MPMERTYLLTAAACLLGLAVRSGYEWLKSAGKVDTRNPAVFAVVFVGMCVMLASWPVMCPLDPRRLALPGAVQWIGLAAAGCALVLAVGGMVQLRGLENIDHLVSTGFYARIRHPMYTGFVLWIAGWVLRHGAVTSLAVGVVCVGNILYWRWLEERALEAQYGEAYQSYRARTWC